MSGPAGAVWGSQATSARTPVLEKATDLLATGTELATPTVTALAIVFVTWVTAEPTVMASGHAIAARNRLVPLLLILAELQLATILSTSCAASALAVAPALAMAHVIVAPQGTARASAMKVGLGLYLLGKVINVRNRALGGLAPSIRN